MNYLDGKRALDEPVELAKYHKQYGLPSAKMVALKS